MTGEWVNVRKGSAIGMHAPRQAHLVESPGSDRARCGFGFAAEDVARTARYPQCRRCCELAAPAGNGDALAIVARSPSSAPRVWVIVRSNLDDWGLYRDGECVASLGDLAEAGRIIAEYESAAS